MDNQEPQIADIYKGEGIIEISKDDAGYFMLQGQNQQEYLDRTSALNRMHPNHKTIIVYQGINLNAVGRVFQELPSLNRRKKLTQSTLKGLAKLLAPLTIQESRELVKNL